MKIKKMISLALIFALTLTLMNSQIIASAEVPAEEKPVNEEASEDTQEEEVPAIELPSAETFSAKLEPIKQPDIKSFIRAGGMSTADNGTGGNILTADSDTDLPTVTPGQDSEDAPILSVMPYKTIASGSKFNPLKGAFAYDDLDGNITSQIVIESNNVDVNTININKDWAGTPYNVVYAITNSRGKTTRVTAEVYVFDGEITGVYSVSATNFSVVQNENPNDKIRNNVEVKKPDGSVADPSEYILAVNGLIYTGEIGKLNISVVVGALEYNTFTEETLTITVEKNVTLDVSDYSVYRSDTAVFDPMNYVEAYEIKADGSKIRLGQSTGANGAGVEVSGTVNITEVGRYALIYTARSSTGTTESKAVTVSVIADDVYPTIIASDQKVEVGTEVTAKMISSWATVNDPVDGDNLPVEFEFPDGVTSIDTSRPITYNITYIFTNSAGNTADKTIKLEVVEKAETGKEYDKDNKDAGKTTGADAVKTGDTSNTLILVLALAASVVIIAGLVYFAKKRKENEV